VSAPDPGRVTDPEPPPDPAPAPDPEPEAEAEPDLSGLPSDFAWGVATAALQIEGDAEHRGTSIWDRFCDEPGRIAGGSRPDVACDHVHRYEQDIALMRELGLDAYRFSISWPRVQPRGRGPMAPAGLAFYDRLIDVLLAEGLQPWVTLYHWDLPAELEDDGGWCERDVVDAFVDYASAVHAAFGDRVRTWATLDEPWCSAWLGYGSGEHAPGVRDHARATRAAHHLLLAHGRAVSALRAQAPADHRLGIVLNVSGIRTDPSVPGPLAPYVDDIALRMDGLQNRWFLDALLSGGYPQDCVDVLAGHLDGLIAESDLDEIGQPLDFLGVAYDRDVRIVPSQPPYTDDVGAYPGTGTVRLALPDEGAGNGPMTPDGLREILLRIAVEYPQAPPLVVAANGSAWPDDVREDPERLRYLVRHVDAVAQAVREGADVRGYFVWSLLDGFAWEWGTGRRPGLVRVDPKTLARSPRASFDRYRSIISTVRS
jgi:beta-glucosidase